MNFDSFDDYPELKQAAEDAYEEQEDQTDRLLKRHPASSRQQIAVELLYHLMVLLFWSGARKHAENAVVRKDDARWERMDAMASAIRAEGLANVPKMKAAEIQALCWGPLSKSLARDIAKGLDERLGHSDDETRLTRIHNEAAAAAARVEDMLNEDVVLYVYGRAQTRDLLGRTEGLMSS